MKREIYLDNSATTPICECAIRAIHTSFEFYANPSSMHGAGLEAEKLVEASRAKLLSALGLSADRSRRVIFTSGGTEANNLATVGIITAKNFKVTPQVITTDSEHPSILEPLYHLEAKGFIELAKLSTKGGEIDLCELENNLCERTALVSIMSANNETGALYDVKEAFDLVKRTVPSAITHTDAVQAFLKTNVNFRSLKADMITVSGHKINAPKGVGALVIGDALIKAKKLSPIVFGGGQEGGLRSGTENVPGICALGEAARYNKEKLSSFIEKTSELAEFFISSLPSEIRVNRSPKTAPHIISITLPKIKSETALHFLSGRGIYVSSGSACASNGKHKSYVLSAFGLSDVDTDCTLRISLSDTLTKDDLAYTANTLSEALGTLVRIP